MTNTFEAPELPAGYFFRVTPYDDTRDYGSHRFDVRIDLMKRGYTVGKWFPKNYPDERVDFGFSISTKPEQIVDRMQRLKEVFEKKLRGPTATRDVLGDYPPKRYVG